MALTRAEISKRWRKRHPEYAGKWRSENRDKTKEYTKKYRSKPIGRATNLLKDYNRHDIEAGRGVGDLTPEWLVENILLKPCAHCGRTGWNIIGCNRLDNSKPHTMDNVEPCCLKCNVKLAGEYNKPRQSKKVDQIDPITGEVIKTWDCFNDVRLIGLIPSNVYYCSQGGRFDKKTNKWINMYTYKGYAWKCHA